MLQLRRYPNDENYFVQPRVFTILRDTSFAVTQKGDLSTTNYYLQQLCLVLLGVASKLQDQISKIRHVKSTRAWSKTGCTESTLCNPFALRSHRTFKEHAMQAECFLRSDQPNEGQQLSNLPLMKCNSQEQLCVAHRWCYYENHGTMNHSLTAA